MTSLDSSKQRQLGHVLFFSSSYYALNKRTGNVNIVCKKTGTACFLLPSWNVIKCAKVVHVCCSNVFSLSYAECSVNVWVVCKRFMFILFESHTAISWNQDTKMTATAQYWVVWHEHNTHRHKTAMLLIVQCETLALASCQSFIVTSWKPLTTVTLHSSLNASVLPPYW